MRRIAIYCLIFSLGGCSYLSHYKELSALQGFGKSQEEAEGYVKKQEKYFYKLADDIKNNRLNKGLSKRKILSRYGDPVFCENENAAPNRQMCLYRDPLRYFSTERAYLYFDENQKLYSWSFEPDSSSP